jgi:hypothetical protein
MRNLAADADLRFFSLNTGSVRAHGDFLTILEAAKRHGISIVSPWREQVAAVGLDRAAKALRDGGFTLSGYCRAGLFPTDAARRQEVRDDNCRAVDEAATLAASELARAASRAPTPPRLARGLGLARRAGGRARVAVLRAGLWVWSAAAAV